MHSKIADLHRLTRDGVNTFVSYDIRHFITSPVFTLEHEHDFTLLTKVTLTVH